MKAISSKKYTLKFNGMKSGDENEDIAYSKMSMGVFHLNGSLKSDIGLGRGQRQLSNISEPIDMPSLVSVFDSGEKFKDLFLYRRTLDNGTYDDRLIAQTTYNLLYCLPLYGTDGWQCVPNVSTSSKCCSVSFNSNGQDVALISGNTNYLIMLSDMTASFNTTAPRFNSMAFHHERVFATTGNDRNRVWFSEDFNPLNWTVSSDEAGYIEFQDEYGTLLEVVSLGDYLFVFKENAIMRITAYADQTEFTVSKIAVGIDRIISGSIVQAGDCIYFLTISGFYSFDGYTVTRLNRYMPKSIDDGALTATALGDKYYYATRLEINGDSGAGDNNALVVYDLRQKTFSIVGGVNILKLLAVNLHHLNKVYAILSGDDCVTEIIDKGENYGLKTTKLWESIETNFGTNDKKVLRRIRIYTLHDITLSVTADAVTTTYKIYGSEKWQNIRIERSGYVMSFSISGKDIDVKPMEFEFDLVE